MDKMPQVEASKQEMHTRLKKILEKLSPSQLEELKIGSIAYLSERQQESSRYLLNIMGKANLKETQNRMQSGEAGPKFNMSENMKISKDVRNLKAHIDQKGITLDMLESQNISHDFMGKFIKYLDKESVKLTMQKPKNLSHSREY